MKLYKITIAQHLTQETNTYESRYNGDFHDVGGKYIRTGWEFTALEVNVDSLIAIEKEGLRNFEAVMSEASKKVGFFLLGKVGVTIPDSVTVHAKNTIGVNPTASAVLKDDAIAFDGVEEEEFFIFFVPRGGRQYSKSDSAEIEIPIEYIRKHGYHSIETRDAGLKNTTIDTEYYEYVASEVLGLF